MRYVLLVILAGVAGLAFVNHQRGSTTSREYSAIASAIARRPVEVRCPSFMKSLIAVDGESGKVEFDTNGRPANHADLSADTCSALGDFTKLVRKKSFGCISNDSCSGDVDKVVVALHTLTHESYHLAGYEDEAASECFAIQTDAYTATRLGASSRVARAIAHYYLESQYRLTSSDYHSPECRPGGRLDLGRGWP
jgi:hypothetical protein